MMMCFSMGMGSDVVSMRNRAHGRASQTLPSFFIIKNRNNPKVSTAVEIGRILFGMIVPKRKPRRYSIHHQILSVRSFQSDTFAFELPPTHTRVFIRTVDYLSECWNRLRVRCNAFHTQNGQDPCIQVRAELRKINAYARVISRGQQYTEQYVTLLGTGARHVCNRSQHNQNGS